MEASAALRITYVFEDGATSDLALGRISAGGILSASRIAEGEEERVATLIEELNAMPQVFVRGGSEASGAEPGTLVKRAVERGTPGFLAALVETARRFYGVDLRFDPAEIGGVARGGPLPTKAVPDPEIEANLAPDPEPEDGPGVEDS